jgi:hypothetical protein
MIEGMLRVLEKAATYPEITPTQRQVIQRQRAIERASLELHKGKKAFAAGDTEAAAGHLARVNAQYHSPKLAMIIILLRVMPRFLRALSRFRDRLMDRLNSPA